ncbi:hypothetical protein HUB98_24050 [Paenibacillus barcinonensis]|uniref:HAMP domain-containing protein n=1 Tax=Paenibacillus barcinonensis TaxID=198119 RepID=A0A2V4UZN2_PAEBA|nr:hypothetical protein [Paenibacillus barcinonensis]PYE45553.1 hypothetical protein DFQ00_119101 [Paenibacillus barcinonensis]QKS58980.1 hypothetical protein HUB98_24050 [Paenibacillus barcinonensis]
MDARVNTVRVKYIYICGASAVLSMVLLFVMYQLTKLAYGFVFHDVPWMTQLVHWCINTIGKKLICLVVGGGLFTLLFWVRSQKIAEDVEQLVRGTHELAKGRIPEPIRVLSSGELRLLSEQINAIATMLAKEAGHTQASRLRTENGEADTHIYPPMGDKRTALPIDLTLYGIQSALEELIDGPGRKDHEVLHWARMAYEQTNVLQHALEIAEGSNPDRNKQQEQDFTHAQAEETKC